MIRAASSAEEYAAFASLIREYVEWCRGRYREYAATFDLAFSAQSLETELLDLPGYYGPPNGKTLLYWDGTKVCGGVAYRAVSDEVCEMKRLFVPSRHAGRGIGRQLCAALLQEAAQSGFRRIRLDTGDLMTEAQAMYGALGFRSCPPFHEYPEALRGRMVFLERSLAPAC